MKISQIIFVFVLLVVKQSFSQTYIFSQHSGEYVELTNATSLNNGVVWYNLNYQIPMGFTFSVQGYYFDNLEFTDDGVLTAISNQVVFFPFDNYLIDRGYETEVSQSPIRYKVDGSEGSRILKIEWKNVGSKEDFPFYNQYINFQAWFYEGSNMIEYRFGPHMINNPSVFYDGYSGVRIGFFTPPGVFYFLTGNAANPTRSTSMVRINGTPSNGTIYRFATAPSSIINHNEFQNFSISPNPVEDKFFIKNLDNKKMELSISNISGAKIYQKTVTTSDEAIDLSGLSSGLYFVTINGITQKIVKL